jgi:hypothetical protein
LGCGSPLPLFHKRHQNAGGGKSAAFTPPASTCKRRRAGYFQRFALMNIEAG